jgi:hypothetical protein
MQRAFDPAKAERFASRVLSALNDGALCLMLSIGHRTGLLDVLSAQTAVTAEELAARAGSNERYVREWLGAMACAGVVDLDPATTRFSLAPEHAACLTRAAAADNMAVFAQYIAVLGRVEDEIVTCFEPGGGLRAVSPLPRGDGREQRPVGALLAGVARAAPGCRA